MLLIEPRVLESLQAAKPPIPDAKAQSLRELDNQMQDALESSVNEHDKADLYYQALRRFLNRAEQYKERNYMKPPPPAPIEKEQTQNQTNSHPQDVTDSVERDVIDSVPKSMKTKAERLLHRLKSNPEVKWNNRGELEFQGKLITNSNITDLINDVLRKRRSAEAPLGWQTFAHVLQTINAPQDLIGNPERWKHIRYQPYTPKTPAASKIKATQASFFTDELTLPKQTPKQKTDQRKQKSRQRKHMATIKKNLAFENWDEY